jgi:phage terminase large subunit GpA-like protein
MFLDSDQRRYFVPCPDCGHMQYLRWANIRWSDNDPETAAYCCESCGVLIPHSQKRWMVERGEWRATAPMKGRHAGFHIWAAYSYSPNAGWPHLVAEFLESKTNPEALKTFVNTVLGECWEEEYSAKVGADGLAARAEGYAPGRLPTGALVVTAGVDVQDNRIAVTLVGWGPTTGNEEAWVIDHLEIYGDPGRPQLWAQLEDVITRPIPQEHGEPVLPKVVAIDSGGHYTQEVYSFVRDRRARGVIAIKGQSQRNKAAIGKPSRVDFNWRGRTVKRGAEVYPVGSDTIKTTVYSRLKVEQPGPGFVHFHTDLPRSYYEQLTSEVKQTVYRHGFPQSQWVLKSGMRNEALDTFVYAYAGLQLLYTRYNRVTIWQQLEQGLKEPGRKPSPRMAPAPSPASISAGRNFASGW